MVNVITLSILAGPFVTTVGATTHVNPETAVDFSGGGFSRLFVQPSYQTSAVNAFLTKLGTTNEGLFKLNPFYLSTV